MPGIDADQGKRLDAIKWSDTETVRYEAICEVVIDVESYQKLCDAEQEYMVRFNRRLFLELERLGRIPPNQALQTTPMTRSEI